MTDDSILLQTSLVVSFVSSHLPFAVQALNPVATGHDIDSVPDVSINLVSLLEIVITGSQ